MTGTIIAIGGGEIRLGELNSINQAIVAYSKKAHPNVLFIPTASSDSESYVEVIRQVFGDLGCNVEALLLLKDKPTLEQMRAKIAWADIIYVGGGNTLKMMNAWRRSGLDILLCEAYQTGKVLAGISAGAMCWFEYGHSDSLSFYHPENWQYIRVRGLGLVRGSLCPHYNGETLGIPRRAHAEKMIRKTGGIWTAVDNHTALVFAGSTARVICACEGASAYKVRKTLDGIVQEALPTNIEIPFTHLYSNIREYIL